MKHYYDCTDEELLSFADEEISKLIDLQCAIDGVPLPPKAPVPPKPFEVAPDVTVYEVAGFNFAEEGTARRVAEAINNEAILNIDYDWQLDRTNYVNGWSDTAAKVEGKKVFSNELYHSTLAARKQFANEEKTYKELRKSYDEVCSQRDDVANTIWARINEVRAERDKKFAIIQKFQQYLDLADGDDGQARKFFTAAYPDEVDYLDPPAEEVTYSDPLQTDTLAEEVS